MTAVPTGSIRVRSRHRVELGDIAGLASSIGSVGLLNPITVDRDLLLVAGGRRLAAVKRLGWEMVEVRVVDGLDGALGRLLAERDENTCRKDMTPSELVSLGLALEELERPKAAARMAAGRPSDQLDTGSGRVRQKVAAALGTSPSTYARAKTVVEATTDADPDVATVATEAMDAMDKGEMAISAAANRVKDAQRRSEAARNGVGHSRPNAPRGRPFEAAMPDVLNKLAGICMGLETASDEDIARNASEAGAWDADLTTVIQALTKFRKRLRSIS